MGGVLSLLRSRKFWLAVCAVFMDVLTNGWTTESMQRAMLVVGALAGLITIEDAASKRAG